VTKVIIASEAIFLVSQDFWIRFLRRKSVLIDRNAWGILILLEMWPKLCSSKQVYLYMGHSLYFILITKKTSVSLLTMNHTVSKHPAISALISLECLSTAKTYTAKFDCDTSGFFSFRPLSNVSFGAEIVSSEFQDILGLPIFVCFQHILGVRTVRRWVYFREHHLFF